MRFVTIVFSFCEKCKPLVKLQCVIVIYVVIPFVIVVAIAAVIVIVIAVVIGYPTKEDQGYIYSGQFRTLVRSFVR